MIEIKIKISKNPYSLPYLNNIIDGSQGGYLKIESYA
jgi:hypothetical protein